MKKFKILALITAVVSAFLLYTYLNKISSPVIIEVEKEYVLTAKENIPSNKLISQDMVELKQIPKEALHPEALNSMEDITGKVSTSQITAGEQILSSKLIKPGESVDDGTLSYAIEPGMRAITVGVNSTKGLANMISPGNMVDIISEYSLEVTTTTGAEKTVDYTVLLLQKVKVLAVDSSLTEAEKAAADDEYSTITLQVTPQEAMELNLTEYSGGLRAVLRSPLDEGVVTLPPLTLDKIIN